MTTKTDYGEVYLVNSRSEILNIPTNFCLDFLNDLKNEDGTLKDHVIDLNDNMHVLRNARHSLHYTDSIYLS